MRKRWPVLGLALLAALGGVAALLPAQGQQQIHRHAFAGRSTVLVRGDANVRVEEKEHDISTQSFKSQPSSEHIKLTCEAGTGDAAFIHYYYETPHAPIGDTLSAGVWVKATKPGIQLRARVVFPKEPDPARPESPLTMLIVADTYKDTSRQWQKLNLDNAPELLGKHLPFIQAKNGRAVNTADAYIDRLVLNLYAGPGPLEVWVDDLHIGPVDATPAPAAPNNPAIPAKQLKPNDPNLSQSRGRISEARGGQILVDGKPFFFRAIRHTGTPLHVLRAAGFDAVWLPSDASQELVDEATREGWFVVPSAPMAENAAVGTNIGLNREANLFDAFLRKFGNSDVLFWDLGSGLTEEQVSRVELTSKVIREGDRRRPLGGDLWDGFNSYSQHLDVVGAHRWPLFTSLELNRYRMWLEQRRQLIAGSRCVYWTWIQNHLPEWYITNVLEKKTTDQFDEPIGPNPEQVRLLAYISIASGCRGLGFWSDRFLADSHHGRDRLQGMALLNTELDMLAPVLVAARDKAIWLDTNHPSVKAAVIRGDRGLVLLPIWMGSGSQYVPEQGAVPALQITVPLVPDGADPWRINPAGVECLSANCVKVTGGTQITIPEFDLVSPIVFTSDLTPNGLVVWWQDHARKYGRNAARWALDMTAFEYEKVRAVHIKLIEAGSQVRDSDVLLQETHRLYREAQKNFAAELYDKAYLDATRALRPLRLLMRDHWQQAIATLDVPSASPYAVSYFSLPKHWELFREVQASRLTNSMLPHGGFEFSGTIPDAGVRVDALPGWTARTGSLEVDRVAVAAGVVSSKGLEDDRKPRETPKKMKGLLSASRTVAAPDEGYLPPAPELDSGVLKLEVRTRRIPESEGKTPPQQPLERTFLAVDSPPVRLPPGTLVRVSAWVKIPQNIGATADGALFYDDAGGEPLAVRLLHTFDPEINKPVWKHYHLYRRIPASGQISVTLALTGVGVAYFDDVRIEPMVPGSTSGNTVAGYPKGANVIPAAYRPPLTSRP